MPRRPGHWVNDNAGTYFYMPVNADAGRLRTTCINYVDIKQTVSATAGKIIVFMDAYITQRVKELTDGRQAPTTIIPASIPDFPITVAK